MTTRDTWATNAAHRLRQHVMRGAIRGRNYAPDTTLELMKRGQVGPHSAWIAKILQRHADMWADNLRQLATNGFETDSISNLAWNEAMTEADAEVDRYVAGLAKGAAA